LEPLERLGGKEPSHFTGFDSYFCVIMQALTLKIFVRVFSVSRDAKVPSKVPGFRHQATITSVVAVVLSKSC
jgi:hypothetical protein